MGLSMHFHTEDLPRHPGPTAPPDPSLGRSDGNIVSICSLGGASSGESTTGTEVLMVSCDNGVGAGVGDGCGNMDDFSTGANAGCVMSSVSS